MDMGDAARGHLGRIVLISFGVHLGRAVANVLAGCDWRFPSRSICLVACRLFCAETRSRSS